MGAMTSLKASGVEAPDNVPLDRIVDFDVYAPPGVESDFHRAWTVLHEPDVPGLVWTPQNEGHWIATRGSLIMEVQSNAELFSSRAVFVPKSFGMKHDVLPTTLDPPFHQPYRRLLNSGLSPRSVRNMEVLIREQVCGIIDGFKDDGHCNFITQYSEILPVYIFLGMLNLPFEDAPKMKYWSDMVVHSDGTMTYEEAKQHFFDYIEHHMELRRGKDGDDMLTGIINAEVNGKPLEKAEIQALGMQLLMAGLDTVVNFLGFVFWFLATNPEHRRQLVDDPERIPAAAEEFLRRFPVVTVARVVRKDTEVDGVLLKEGDMVVVPSALVGTDGQLNECPFSVDFERPSIQHTTFGRGNHVCPGANLARSEISITIEEWLKRIPDFEIAPGEEISFKGGLVGTVNSLPLVWDVPSRG